MFLEREKQPKKNKQTTYIRTHILNRIMKVFTFQYVNVMAKTKHDSLD